MKLRAGYKNTEVGIIPEDWDLKKLGDCLLKNPDYGINAAAAVSSVGYLFYHGYLLMDFRKENNTGIIPFFVFKFEDIIALKRLLTSPKK